MAGAPTRPLQFENPGQPERTSDPEMESFERRARMRAESQYAGEVGEAWARRLEQQFAQLPKGTIVVINCRTGEYVVGASRLAAGDEFERRFGKCVGYMMEIGGGIFVGGGIG